VRLITRTADKNVLLPDLFLDFRKKLSHSIPKVSDGIVGGRVFQRGENKPVISEVLKRRFNTGDVQIRKYNLEKP